MSQGEHKINNTLVTNLFYVAIRTSIFNHKTDIHWKQIKIFHSHRILAYSPEQLQFAAEVRWAERDNGNIWVLTSRFQKFFKKQVNTRDTNIRILRIRPEDILPQTPFLLSRHLGIPARPIYYNRTLGIF